MRSERYIIQLTRWHRFAPSPHRMKRHETSVRKGMVADAAAMPDMEQAAGELFRTWPDLAWIADSPNRGMSEYQKLVGMGWSWIALTSRERRVGFLVAEPFGTALHIWELAVVPLVQRQGIGSALIRAALETAKQAGLTRATLTTFSAVPWNAEYYEKLGFRRLSDDDWPHHLKQIVEAETVAGLAPESRCAMGLDLATFPAAAALIVEGFAEEADQIGDAVDRDQTAAIDRGANAALPPRDHPEGCRRC